MTDAELRSWLQTSVDDWRAANYPTLPVIYEGAEVPDQASIGPVWLDVCVRYTGGGEATIGSRPMGRDVGNLSLAIYSRAGEGMAQADAIRTSLSEHFRTNNRGDGVVLGYPVRILAPPGPLRGWHKTGLLVPFKNDQQ